MLYGTRASELVSLHPVPENPRRHARSMICFFDSIIFRFLPFQDKAGVLPAAPLISVGAVYTSGGGKFKAGRAIRVKVPCESGGDGALLH